MSFTFIRSLMEQEKALKRQGWSLLEEQWRQASDYITILEDWNKVHNFTSVCGWVPMFWRHIIDSWTAISYISAAHTLADFGSGPGLPGIPLAIYYPEKTFILVESRAKRVAFLEHVVRRLSLKNVRICPEKAPRLSLEPALLDVVLSRAFGPLPELINYSLPFMKKEGFYLLHKGLLTAAELAFLQSRHYSWSIHPAWIGDPLIGMPQHNERSLLRIALDGAAVSL